MSTKPVLVPSPASTGPGCSGPGPADPGGDVNSIAALFTPEKQVIDLGAALVAPEDAEKRVFVQFDAWTDPRILKWLQDNEASLPQKAKALFVDDRPKIDDIGLLKCGFALLPNVPLDRAVRMLAGEKPSATLDITTKEMKARLTSLSWELSDVIRKLAAYLYAIFSKHYGAGVPSDDLKRAFIHFADGRLRISPNGAEWMNAEPDSYYFFSFAEFCIQAARYNAEPGDAFWLPLGAMFAALQDVYCLRYHKKDGRRATRDYGDEHYDGGRREIDDNVLLAHVNSVIKRENSLDNLVQRVTWNAFWYFFDDVIGE